MDVLRNKPSCIFHVFNWKKQFYLFDSTTNSLFSTKKEVYLDYQKNTWTQTLIEAFQEGRKSGFFLQNEENIDSFIDQRCYKSLCLMVTRKCNYACKYCFEQNQPVDSTISFMSKDTAKNALDWLVRNSGQRKQLEIDFFGGEPLLVFSLIREIVEYARSLEKKFAKHFLFSLTTNASQLNEAMAVFFKEHHISVILSLDGRKKPNDLFRVDHQKKGTHDQALRNILDLIPFVDTGYYVRGTYTHQTLHFANEVKYLYYQGIRQISFEPVACNQKGIAIQSDDMPALRKEYERLTDWMIVQSKKDPHLHFYHFEVNLKKSLCQEKLATGCGAGVEYLSVSPEGNLYPCHQFDGRRPFLMGSVNNNNDPDPKLREHFKLHTTLYSREECTNCWARMLCGGGCLANSFLLQDSWSQPYSIGCNIQKLRLEAALYFQGKLAKIN